MVLTSTEALTVHTPFLAWFGGITTVGGVVLAILAFGGSWLGPFVCLTLFGGSGAALLFMAARVTATAEGIEVKRFISRKYVSWNEISSVEFGGGNLVFSLLSGGRLVSPGAEFWVGKDKPHFLLLLNTKLHERGIVPRAKVRAMFRSGDRS
jgi:hypothetical protein